MLFKKQTVRNPLSVAGESYEEGSRGICRFGEEYETRSILSGHQFDPNCIMDFRRLPHAYGANPTPIAGSDRDLYPCSDRHCHGDINHHFLASNPYIYSHGHINVYFLAFNTDPFIHRHFHTYLGPIVAYP